MHQVDHTMPTNRLGEDKTVDVPLTQRLSTTMDVLEVPHNSNNGSFDCDIYHLTNNDSPNKHTRGTPHLHSDVDGLEEDTHKRENTTPISYGDTPPLTQQVTSSSPIPGRGIITRGPQDIHNIENPHHMDPYWDQEGSPYSKPPLSPIPHHEFGHSPPDRDTPRPHILDLPITQTHILPTPAVPIRDPLMLYRNHPPLLQGDEHHDTHNGVLSDSPGGDRDNQFRPLFTHFPNLSIEDNPDPIAALVKHTRDLIQEQTNLTKPTTTNYTQYIPSHAYHRGWSRFEQPTKTIDASIQTDTPQMATDPPRVTTGVQTEPHTPHHTIEIQTDLQAPHPQEAPHTIPDPIPAQGCIHLGAPPPLALRTSHINTGIHPTPQMDRGTQTGMAPTWETHLPHHPWATPQSTGHTLFPWAQETQTTTTQQTSTYKGQDREVNNHPHTPAPHEGDTHTCFPKITIVYHNRVNERHIFLPQDEEEE